MRQSQRFGPDRPASRWPIIGVALLAVCGNPSQATVAPDPPIIEATAVTAKPGNVLSAVVRLPSRSGTRSG
jgi:hypothetical protein